MFKGMFCTTAASFRDFFPSSVFSIFCPHQLTFSVFIIPSSPHRSLPPESIHFPLSCRTKPRVREGQARWWHLLIVLTGRPLLSFQYQPLCRCLRRQLPASWVTSTGSFTPRLWTPCGPSFAWRGVVTLGFKETITDNVDLKMELLPKLWR